MSITSLELVGLPDDNSFCPSVVYQRVRTHEVDGIEPSTFAAFDAHRGRSVAVDLELFITSSEIVRQPRDHSCFYHSLVYCINQRIWSSSTSARSLLSSIQHMATSFDASSLRTYINDYVSNPGSTVIRLGYFVTSSIVDAIHLVSGLSLDDHVSNQSNLTSWGGILEATTAVLVLVGYSSQRRNKSCR